MTHQRKIFIVVFSCLIMNVGLMAKDLLIPSIVVIANNLKCGLILIQLGLSGFVLCTGVSQFGYGVISDRYSRKLSLLIRLVISFIGLIGILLSRSGMEFFLFMLTSGVGFGAVNVNARAILGNNFTDRELIKSLSYLSMAVSFSPLAAPVFGAYISTLGSWRYNIFFVIALIYTCMFFLRFIADEKSGEHSVAELPPNTSVVSLGSLYSYLILSSCSFALIILLYVATPSIFQNALHVPMVENSYMYVFASVGYFTGSAVVPLAKKISEPNLIFLSTFICMVGAILMLISSKLIFGTLLAWILCALFGFSLFGVGMLTPVVKKIY